MSDMTNVWWMHPPHVKPQTGGLIRFGGRARMVDKAVCMTLRRRIQQRLDALDISMRAASLRAGLGTHFVRDLMSDPMQSPKADNLSKLAAALETTTEWLLEERGEEIAQGVPIMGYVGSGAHYHPYEDQGQLDMADTPPGATGKLGAARITGDSNYPVYRDGETIYFREFREDVSSLIRRDVIAELADGSMLLKTLAPSVKPGCYSLKSYNAPDIDDVVILRAAEVEYVARSKPR
jgi:hypothetical protein